MTITKQEYEKLTSKKQDTEVKFFNLNPRTLLYGYTCARNTFHVYFDNKCYVNKFIYDFVYDKILFHKRYEILTNVDLKDLVPDKRVYPESMDYEFLLILLTNQVYVPFTCYNEPRFEQVKNLQYHGEVFSEDKLFATKEKLADSLIND